MTNEWSTNYDTSFKITKTASSTYIYLWNYQEYSIENKRLQVAINQNITTSSYHLQMIQYDSSKQELKWVQVGVNSNTANPIILTDVTVENVKYISIRILRYGDVGNTIFFDDIIITETDL